MTVKYKRLIALAKSECWAMRPEHMDILCEVLSMRRQNKRFSEDELASRLALQKPDVTDKAYFESDRGERKPYVIERGVAVIPLEGVIMPKANYFDQISGATSLATFQARLAAAIADESVKAVMLEIDSPGGMVLGVSEAEKAIRLAAKQKPVHAWVRGLCCSAAYWLASACTQIHAPLTTQVGSIGVYRMHVDQSGADAEFGEKYSYIFAGDRKVDGNPHQALAGKAKAAWQASVDEAYGMFTGVVMRNRGLKGDVGDVTGQGESFYGETAKRMRLIDSNASRSEVIEKLGGKEAATPLGMAAMGAHETVAHTDAAASVETLQGAGERGSSFAAAEETAAAAAGTGADTRSGGCTPERGFSMKKELKALLYAVGVIKSMDDDDTKCWDKLEGWAEAKGFAFSQDKQDEIVAHFTQLARGKALGSTEKNSALAAAGVQNKEAKIEDVLRQDRERADEIRARATLLKKSGFVISDAQVKEAIDNSWSVEQAAGAWTKLNPAQQTEARHTIVNTVENELQAMHPKVSEALGVLMGNIKPQECKSREAAALATKGSMALAEHVCKQLGMNTLYMDNEEIAKAFLKVSAGPVSERTNIRALTLKETEAYQTASGDRAEGPIPYYGVGSHPNLFANPAQRFLMDSLQLAATTYQTWCHRMPDADKLGMEEGVAYNAYGELPRELDGIPSPGTSMISKRIMYIETEPFSDTIGLTWQQVHRNKILDFATVLRQRMQAAARTINRQAIELLVSNPVMWDGKTLFHTDHFNDITSGGVPSLAQYKKHDTAYGKQVDIDGQTEITVLPKYVLTPADIRVEAKQMQRFQQVQGNATVDPTKLGVWDDLIPIVDAMLRSYSASKWYTFADPSMGVAPVHYQHLAGYGEGGKTTTWWDPETESQKWKIKTVFGLAQGRFEGCTRDAG